MLKRHARRLALRLFGLFVLVAALAAPAFSPLGQKAKAGGFVCYNAIDDSGGCVIICCDDTGCTGTPCP
jgi:hypothetical protein